MRRRLASLAVLAALAPLALPAGGHAAEGAFFVGQPIDAAQRIGDLDVARDGSGAVAYVKSDGGVDHVFVSRLVGGAWQPPERIDVGLAGAGSQPVVAVSDGGRVAVAFVSGGTVYSSVKVSGSAAYTAPTAIGGGRNPAIDMSINGVAYVVFAAPGASAGDVRAARLERAGAAFGLLPDTLDIDPARDAGLGEGRPVVAVAADGIATAVWGEAGHVYARRIFEQRLSSAPQDLNVATIAGAVGGAADRPDIDAEDDSSFAWVVFRQQLGGARHAIARRLVGSQFEAPTVVDGGDVADTPRIAINGRGVGYAGVGATSGAAYGAVLKDDVMNLGVGLGGGGLASLPAPAADETGDGVIAYQAGDATIRARAYDYVAATRAVTAPGAEALISEPALGPTDAADGLFAAANRVGDVAIVFIQGTGASRQLMGAAFDRLPGAFRTYPTRGTWQSARPRLRWSPALESWGGVTYEVQIDGKPNGTTAAHALRVPTAIPDGVRRWRIIAIDRRGQRRASSTRVIRVDGSAPRAVVRISGQRRRGGVLRVSVSATDRARAGARASGIDTIRTSFGDGSRALSGKRVRHRYRRAGTRTIRVTIIDRAGNRTVIRRSVRIRG